MNTVVLVFLIVAYLSLGLGKYCLLESSPAQMQRLAQHTLPPKPGHGYTCCTR